MYQVGDIVRALWRSPEVTRHDTADWDGSQIGIIVARRPSRVWTWYDVRWVMGRNFRHPLPYECNHDESEITLAPEMAEQVAYALLGGG